MGDDRSDVKVPDSFWRSWQPPFHNGATGVIAVLAAVHALGGVHLDIVTASGLKILLTML